LSGSMHAVFPEPRWNMDQQVQTESIMVRPLAQRKNMRGTNVARLRISVWFVGDSEVETLSSSCSAVAKTEPGELSADCATDSCVPGGI